MFKITKWGPKKLQAIFQEAEDEINGITPLQGRGIIFEWRDDGVLIETVSAVAASQAGDGSSGTGPNINVYGAFNGNPVLFHLLQSAPPTPL